MELLGLGAIVWGIALFSIPAAFIFGGIGLLLIGLAVDPPLRKPGPPRVVEQ
ncbi:hypothetical protein JRC04_04915 [Mycolicibacterium sp. S2-37]|uniref:hypothetical protein n=1 Tax=Mycolicibacterium sp. S2-37 TaxID=2810297 RepID=UPI001A9530FF|nr:hypothetical protein [Mycolicibacterium sp. S2-37]MBO0676801.1 hypothetical protein [Mycolicibacterium sp. S2-37]